MRYWLTLRIRHTLTCREPWTDGDRVGHKACSRCGVWRTWIGPMWWIRLRNRHLHPFA